jgi:hypothetical protein
VRRRGRFYTQNRLSDEAFSEFKTDADIEFNQLGALKMILMEQLRSDRLGPDRLSPASTGKMNPLQGMTKCTP